MGSVLWRGEKFLCLGRDVAVKRPSNIKKNGIEKLAASINILALFASFYGDRMLVCWFYPPGEAQARLCSQAQALNGN